ncbi:MAG: DUF362 domain-containing protein [Bacilli bacterium]|nr:DUF362 domain-containing protein [Bacilli bacterium]
MEKPKVYFSSRITEDNVIELYKKLNISLNGRVAVKVHSGEEGNQNYLRPLFLKPIIDYVGGTVVECNTAYDGARDTTEKHLNLMSNHDWNKYFNVDILDSDSDMEISVPNGKVITKNYVGSKLKDYDSILVLSHFKGHPMGGFGGALKQLSIGFASSKGKRYIHCAGKENGSYEDMFETDQLKFISAMADAASSVHKYFENRIAYINIMCNLSVDCDCCKVAEDPCMKDIGILASLDPIALDQACIDLVYNSCDPGRDHLVERIESRHGTKVIDDANSLRFGTREYELINID